MIEIHVRHGEYSKDCGWGLTQEGKRQARSAAAYITEHFPNTFSAYIHSGSRRAKETALILQPAGSVWEEDRCLREIDWNSSPEPRKFAPWRGMFTRVAAACQSVDDSFDSKNRILVSHGGSMRMVRAFREHLEEENFPVLFTEPYKYFTNCQLIIYTDEDPEKGNNVDSKLWVKSVCPWNQNHSGHDWLEVSANGCSIHY